MKNLTDNQSRAIEAKGNVLVMAGAGTGKTHTLVECCVRRLLDGENPVSLDEILMVTFTEAAAGEMRRRIRERLEQAIKDDPGNLRLGEQLALVETARISTLHSFCLELVRDHFHELNLDPQLSVLPQERARILATETLEEVFERHYAGQSAEDDAVRQLAMYYGGYQDVAVRRIVLRVHDYIQTLPSPRAWLERQKTLLDHESPEHWNAWLLDAVSEWRSEWIERLLELPPENPNAKQCAAILQNAPEKPGIDDTAAMLAAIAAVDDDWPKGRKTELREPLADIFDEAEFLQSLMPCDQTSDPLKEDWDLVRPHLRTLLRLIEEFGEAFASAKRERGVVDFHDLEQLSLRLLWDADFNRPTSIAQQWRSKLRYIFVDEFQDINAAQDTILRALAREGADANRFLVGDLKQSIYRFRLADPRICRAYAERFADDPAAGQVIPLNDNFRSRAAILDFANSVFELLMRPELGGVDYDDDARLRFAHVSKGQQKDGEFHRSPCVELLLRLTGRIEDASDSGDGEAVAGVSQGGSAEQEALVVGRRLARLKAEKFQVWDDDVRGFRPVEWRDMAVLLRAPRNRAEAFATAFDRLGIPLVSSRGGLYETIEVSDLLQLLRVLDNPVQDIPLIAVLRSPIVGMTLDELAVVRIDQRSGDYWAAIRRFHDLNGHSDEASQGTSAVSADSALAEESPAEAGLDLNDQRRLLIEIRNSAWKRIDAFLQRFSRWRRIARRHSVSSCLECVLEETHYEDWLEAQHPSGQAVANVRRFLEVAREFDRSQGRGLFQFLQQVDAQVEMEYDPEPAVIGGENAVRLMSVHQSKGLEFPVVVVADIGRRFNLSDSRGHIVLDEELGICARVRARGKGQFYPSLPHWMAARRQKRESLSEELRLLYVAVTRAADLLILCGSTSEKTARERWEPPMGGRPTTRALLGGRCWLDWLGPLMPRLCENPEWLEKEEGTGRLVRWQLYREDGSGSQDEIRSELPVMGRDVPGSIAAAAGCDVVAEFEAICDRLEKLHNWQYPHVAATFEAAKASVSVLRRRVIEETQTEAAPLFQFDATGLLIRAGQETAGLSPAERGTAHHRFIELADLAKLATAQGARSEAARLATAGFLTPEEVNALDFEAVSAFWQSDFGKRLLAHSENLVRELEFTARFSPDDLRALGVPVQAGLGPDEFIVVQGIVDLAVILEDQLWILDFKTDQIDESGLKSKVDAYRPQVRAYGIALERTYNRPASEIWLHFLALNRSVKV